MLLKTDERRRITIPPDSGIKPGDAVEMEVLPDGRIMLVPMLVIPRHQAWAWTPECRKAVAASLADPRPSIVIETPEDARRLAKRWAVED